MKKKAEESDEESSINRTIDSKYEKSAELPCLILKKTESSMDFIVKDIYLHVQGHTLDDCAKGLQLLIDKSKEV